jgi:sugar (pentulose or hexulose) kinase
MPAFFEPGGMPNKIRAYCADTGQPVPESIGEIARCVYESLALKYRWALERLEEIKGGRIHTLNIVGGGIQNKLLNQMAADATGRRVVTGPVEGAAMGNILMQAAALGELKGIGELRQVVRASVETQEYLPKRTPAWEDAYERLMRLMEEKQ